MDKTDRPEEAWRERLSPGRYRLLRPEGQRFCINPSAPDFEGGK